jgi:hypothetical protein
LWYDPRLRLQHFLPNNRLRWEYLRKCNFGFGLSTVHLDPYYFAVDRADEPAAPRGFKQARHGWIWHTLRVLKALLREHPRILLLAPFVELEGKPGVLRVEGLCGRLIALLPMRGQHDTNIERVRNTAWRHAPRARALPSGVMETGEGA